MKRFIFLGFTGTGLFLATYGCSQGDLTPTNTNTPAAGNAATATGGAGGTTGGTGGTTGGTGGTTGGIDGTTGGTGGTAGSGTGGTTGGSAGTGATTVGGGAGTGATGGAGGSAGMMSAGGAGGSMGGMGQGGTAGTGMAGTVGMAGTGAGGTAGGGGLDPKDIVPDLVPFYWEGTCSGDPSVSGSSGHNCPISDALTSCPSNGITHDKTFMVKGTAGQAYTINIDVRGVIGTRCYTGGMRASSAAISDDGTNNWWYVGGSYANPTGWWNTYELHVTPSTGDASGDVYYFNGSGVQGGNDCEREATYLVKYTASFKVKGGGSMKFTIHDQNCKGQQNCGSNTDGNSTCAARMVDLTGATPPSGFKQPPTNQLDKTYYPQWMLITATSITSP